MYGADGHSMDRIQGNEFEYDQKTGEARAAGPVEITLSRLGEASSILPGNAQAHALSAMAKTGPLAAAVEGAKSGEIQVKTQRASPSTRRQAWPALPSTVQFAMSQGSGSARGRGLRLAEGGSWHCCMTWRWTRRRGADPVKLMAAHGEFDRGDQVCYLNAATVNYRDGTAHAQEAKIAFRDDGTAERLDATRGFVLITTTGGHLAAPTAMLACLTRTTSPRTGTSKAALPSTRTTMDAQRMAPRRQPSSNLAPKGLAQTRAPGARRGVRERRPPDRLRVCAPCMDLAGCGSRLSRCGATGQMELASMHGTGGVTVNSESRRGTGPVTSPARFTADDVTGIFGADSALTAMTGVGHAHMDQTALDGTQQSTGGDRLEAHFANGADVHKPRRGCAD